MSFELLIEMINRNLIVICFLSLGFVTAKGQNCSLDVKIEVLHATNASDNGSVSFEVEGQSGSKDYSIYKITSNQQDEKVKPSYKFKDLAVGVYEFVVIDHKRERCTKEVQVKIEQK